MNTETVLEQIHNDENSVMPPPSLMPRGLTVSTPVTAPGVSSVSPTSGASVQAETAGWATSSAGHLQNTSVKSHSDDDKGEDVSEEEEAADLLVYFHARSGAGETTAGDDPIEVPDDERRATRAMSGSSASSSSPTGVGDSLGKRKRQETDEDLAELTSDPTTQLENQVSGIGSGNIFPGKSDGMGTAKEGGKGLYLDQVPPTGSVDLANLLRQPGQNG